MPPISPSIPAERRILRRVNDTPPGIDVNRPVENPELVARLARWRDSPVSEDEVRQTLRMMREATYLLASRVWHPDGGQPISDGTMRAGTRIDIYTVLLPDDRSALCLFTDWRALRAAVGEGSDWRGLIQRGQDAFGLGLQPDYPGGVVVNPSGPDVTMEMGPEQIASMFAA